MRDGHYFYNKHGFWNKVTMGNIDEPRLVEEWYKNDLFHREDGPAEINYITTNDLHKVVWYINGKNITQEVDQWIVENNYPRWIIDGMILEYDPWDDNIKTHFKMRFVG